MATEVGAYLDPLADKVLIVSIYVSLGVVEAIPRWLVILVVSRDLLIVGGIMLSWVLGNPSDHQAGDSLPAQHRRPNRARRPRNCGAGLPLGRRAPRSRANGAGRHFDATVDRRLFARLGSAHGWLQRRPGMTPTRARVCAGISRSELAAAARAFLRARRELFARRLPGGALKRQGVEVGGALAGLAGPRCGDRRPGRQRQESPRRDLGQSDWRAPPLRASARSGGGARRARDRGTCVGKRRRSPSTRSHCSICSISPRKTTPTSC